ncbi:GNAT family N-acetyltransferase [Kitasatospora sp. NPDC048365]|uniref:GNAT family N-acetyltransferase n=1 Tax=Kitasatospora sp. NPDC048365 TaxID=3364050 RepID=UPI0037225A7B
MAIDGDPLTGKLVRLRELRESDLPRLADWWRDPALAVQQVTGPVHPQPDGALAEMFRSWSRNTGSDLGLSVETVETRELAGHITLYGANPKDRAATLAIVMGPPFQDRGLGTDALRTTIGYAFNELGLNRVELTVNSYNARAIAAYARAGFVEEGRRREAVYRSGGWHDQVLMSVLRREWPPAGV